MVQNMPWVRISKITPKTIVDTYILTKDRQKREIRPPNSYGQADMISFALTGAEHTEYQEPASYKEAMENEQKCNWLSAMKKDMCSVRKNNTWELVLRPKGQRVVGCKWIYKLKESGLSQSDVKFNASLVAKGFTQVEGFDYNEIYSPVVKHTSIRICSP